ncbi:hypothetical protein D917_09624 [Trichinella nativa]|uniref:Uncharacterized protein n=1 Tax=Trichinella nativa TaxID=6335 RepID=A0A1Y3EET2_9BILA|nr:hypothetical protein D917_09624 [Trichinella nativa]
MERKNYLSRYKRGFSKQKANQPSGNFIALGPRAQLPTTSSLEKRRCSLASPAVLAKTRLTDRSPSVSDKSSLAEFSRNLNKAEIWHESFTPLDAYDKLLNSNGMKVDDMARLLLSVVKGLCAKFENFPDPMSSLLLVYIAKHQPEAYADANVIEALCTLIVKVPQQRSLWQAWSNLFCVICESLMIALDEKTDWPECIAKAFIQDSLGERLWVDRKECNTFVKNIITVFNTVLPAYDAIDTLVSECIQTGGMVKCLSPTYSLIVETGPSVNEFFPKHKVRPRFVRISDSFCSHTSELLREFVSRRLDSVPRNLLLTLASCCGHEEIRQMASQKLDGWLQTNKVGRIFSLQVIVSCFKIMRLLFQMNKPLAILLLTTFINCKALLMPTDKEVLHNLIRIRFKSKVVNRIFAIALKELFSLNCEAMQLLICILLRNEQAANRSSTSPGIINYCFQHDAEKAVYYLAAIIFDFISSKEDHSRMLKNVLREIQRGVLKSEFPLLLFCKTLFNEWKTKSEQMQAHKERVCHLMEELFCAAVLLHVPQFTKDLPANWRKDCSIWIPLHKQIRSALHEAVLWLKYRCASDSAMCKVDTLFVFHFLSINIMLFLNKPEFYSTKDYGLMDQERSFNYKAVCESGLDEETFYEILSSTAAGQLPLSGLEKFEIVEAIVHRSCASPFNDQINLHISDGKIIDYVLQCCVLQIPHHLEQQMVKLANAVFYWRAWIVTIIFGALNPKSVGEILWNCYPIAQCFMHMVITDDFVYPPAVLTCKENLERDQKAVAELEAIVGKELTESCGISAAQMIIYNPCGPVRSPPQSTVELLQRITMTYCLKNRMCLSRSPDFLMDIMNRQGDICSAWLVDLVRRNDDPFKYLPVACSCEFFLNDCEDADKLDLTSDAIQLLDTSNNNTSTSSVSSTGSASDPSCQSLRSELKRKRICLANELKRTIHDDKGDRHMAVQALSYLIGRLKDESSRTRCFTVQAFQELLKEEGEGRDLPKTEDRDVSCEPEYFWLFSALPSLPYYRDVIENVTDALLSVNIANAHNFEAVLFIFFPYVKACLVETDLLRLHAYIAYLHQHVDEQQSTRYCMAMCNFINKRNATFLQLVPVSAEDANELFKIATFSRLLKLFYNHILQSVNKTAKDVVRDYFQVLSILFFFSNVIHIHRMKIEFRKLKKEVKILFTCTSATKFPPFIKNSFLLCNYCWWEFRMLKYLKRQISTALFRAYYNLACQLTMFRKKLLRKLNNLLESSQNIPHSTVQQLLAMRYIIGAYVENGSVASDQYLRLVHKYTVADESQQQQLYWENAEIEDEDEDEPMDVAYDDNVALTTWSCEECLQALFVELKDDLDYGWISPLQEAVSELLADFSPALLLSCAKWLCDTFSTWKVDAGILKNYNSLQTILIVLLCLETEEEVRMCMSSLVERLRKIPNFDGEEVIRGCRRLLGKEISEIRRRTSLPEFTDSAIEKRKLVSSFDRSLIRFNPELMSTTITDVIEYAVSSANPSQNQVVLFALLHMTKLSTVVDIVHCMLSDYFDSYNPTIILDFVAASYKSLRLPCSQDLRPVRFYERPFHLEADHLLSLAKYILAEFSIHLVPLVSLGEAPAGECVEWLGGSDEVLQSEQNWRNVREELSMQSALLEMRMKLLLEACDDDRQLMPVINWLEIKRAQDNELRELCDLMIMHIYFKRTGSCPISGGGYPLSDHLSELVNWQYNHMDTVLHHLIRRSAALARQANVKDELKVVCSMLRRHASFHPELVVRHLPLIAALLRGTTEIDGRSYTQTNYLFWFAELMSLLKLLMPQACNKCFMHVLRNNSLLGYADNMFALLNSFLSESYCAIKYLLAKEPLIRTIAERYPEVVSIQAVISFIENVVNFEREIDDDGSFTSSPSSPSSTPVNSTTTALPADDSRPISQKSSPLISLVSSSENTITVKGIKQLFEEADECFQTDREKIASCLENVSTYMLNVNEEVRKSAVALTLKLAKEYPSKYECILPTIYAALEGDNMNALKVLLESFGEISIVFPTQILSRLFGMAFSRLLVDDSLRELFVQFFMHLLLTVNHVSANASAERH